MSNPFDCACGHTAGQHREKIWPSFIPRCSECDCRAYEPNYKAGQ